MPCLLYTSSAFKKFENDAYLVMENGNLVLMATASKDNKYARLADTFNSRAGACLLYTYGISEAPAPQGGPMSSSPEQLQEMLKQSGAQQQ